MLDPLKKVFTYRTQTYIKSLIIQHCCNMQHIYILDPLKKEWISAIAMAEIAWTMHCELKVVNSTDFHKKSLIPDVYSRPYVYSFWQIFQALCLFPALRLFRTLEYELCMEPSRNYVILVGEGVGYLQRWFNK